MGLLQSIFGSKPSVPKVPPLNLQTEQARAISGNTQQLPGAESMVSQANQLSREQITAMLESVIPGYAAMTGQAPQNIQSELGGEVPQDVSDFVKRQSAAGAASGGYGAGSGMGRNLVSRDLGLTSLDMTRKGLSAAESWIKMADAMYAPSMMNVSSMFITPSQQAAFSVEERNAQVQQQWLQNQVGAMPDPVIGGISSQIGGLVRSFLGGMGSGAGSSLGSSLFSGGGGSANWGADPGYSWGGRAAGMGFAVPS